MAASFPEVYSRAWTGREPQTHRPRRGVARKTHLHSPWTRAGTAAATAAAARGGPTDRRGFLFATGTTLAAVGAHWAATTTAGSEPLAATGHRLSPGTVTRLEQRLDDLRRLDDVLGGAELRPPAVAEFDLISGLADHATYDEACGRRLFTALAEAARLAGWLHFDADRHASAQTFYITALRAAATAGDEATGANILAFLAIQTYSVGNPQDAVNLVRTAQAHARHATARVRSMLHARAARALSKTGDRTGSARELDAARTTYAVAAYDDDPAWSYWMSDGEIEMLAASAVLDLGDPRRALVHFDAARAYAADGYVRDNALYLARAAGAHLDMGDLDAACTTATSALEQSVDSARPTGALTDLRRRLVPHRRVAAVRDFLDRSA